MKAERPLRSKRGGNTSPGTLKAETPPDALPQCFLVISGLALARVLEGLHGPGRGEQRRLISTGANPHVSRALRQANARAWVAIEVLMAGEVFWERAQLEWERCLEEEFYRPLRSFLDDVSPAPLKDLAEEEYDAVRQGLASALRAGVLTSGSLETGELLHIVGQGSDARNRAQLEWELIGLLVKELDLSGAPQLRPLFELCDSSSASLLVGLVAALFRRAVLADGDLFDGLAIALETETLSVQEQMLADIAYALDVHRSRFDTLLHDVETPAATRVVRRRNDNSADMHFQRGRSNAHQGNYDSAIADFTSALRLEPTLVDAYAQRGDAHRLKGDFPQALADYSTALRLDPGHAAALLSRGQVHWLSHKYREAVTDYSALLQLDPRHAAAHHFRGKAHLDAGDPRAAMADFTEAQRLAPTSPWPCHDRGDAHVALGEHDRAIADYTQALHLNPQATLSYLRRADAYSAQAAYDRAVSDYTQALQLDPLNAAAYLSRGAAYRKLGKLDQAASDFTRALELDGCSAEGFSQRGGVFHQRGDHERAIDDLDAAIRLDSENAGLYLQRGQAVAAAGNVKLALADLCEAIRLNPDFAEAHIHRGLLYAGRGENDLALRDFSTALRVDGTYAEAYAHRARVLVRMGLFEDAVADCGQALRHQPDLIVAYIVRASATAQQGKYEEATADLTLALERDPTHLHAFFLRGVAHAKAGRVSHALADFSTVIRLDMKHARAFAQRALVLRDAGEQARAVNDLAHAARLDGSYAAAYCEQLALFHTSRGEHERAVADYVAALQLDPNNQRFAAAKEQAWRDFQSRVREARQKAEKGRPIKRKAGRKRLTSRPAALKPTQPDLATPEDLPVGKGPEPGSAGADDRSFEVNLRADAEADAVVEADEMDVTVVDEDDAAASEAPAADAKSANDEAPDPELARKQEADRVAKLAEFRRRQVEEHRAKEEAQKRKKERDQRSRRADDHDPNRMPLWKKGMLAAAAAVALWFSGSWVMDAYADYRAQAPISLASLFRDFASDADKARKKYDGGVFELSGKAKLVKAGHENRLVLESPNAPDWALHCRFEMAPKVFQTLVADAIKPGQDVTVSGRCSFQPKEGKGVIVMEECEIRNGS